MSTREQAIKTGICPMCEDCPDGCPLITPNDSRNVITQFDHLRSLSNEDLAWKITFCTNDGTMVCPDGQRFYRDAKDECIDQAISHTLEWGRMPYKEANNG